VVATAVGGVPDAVVDEVTGILVAADDATTLAAALRRLHADPRLRERLGAAGRETARARFGEDADIGKLTALYETLADGRRREATGSAHG
jgi:glycosyltransferase involved in cell wall biosynthesis